VAQAEEILIVEARTHRQAPEAVEAVAVRHLTEVLSALAVVALVSMVKDLVALEALLISILKAVSSLVVAEPALVVVPVRQDMHQEIITKVMDQAETTVAAVEAITTLRPLDMVVSVACVLCGVRGAHFQPMRLNVE
jgi:predicted pyridoxine 5'-phosphate oxidase superfamily flavin-nucleotide-binding protein